MCISCLFVFVGLSQQRNGLPAISGKWRKEPYGARTYEYLTDYSVTSNIGDEEGTNLRDQLITPLNGFLGQAYNYDDHDLTEEWMVTFQNKGSGTGSGACGDGGISEDDVIRTQLESLLEIMMVSIWMCAVDVHCDVLLCLLR